MKTIYFKGIMNLIYLVINLFAQNSSYAAEYEIKCMGKLSQKSFELMKENFYSILRNEFLNKVGIEILDQFSEEELEDIYQDYIIQESPAIMYITRYLKKYY